MKPNTRRQFAVSTLVAQAILLVFVMLVSVVPAAAQGTGKNRSVLVLFSDEAYDVAQEVFEDSLRSALANGSSSPIEVYPEYLDTLRTHLPDHEKELVGQLQRKYQGRKFDLIITVSADALNFLSKNQADIFPDTPVVFYLLTPPDLTSLKLEPNRTGIWGELNFKPNLDLALVLHPHTRKVVVVAGVGDFDKLITDKVRADYKAYEDRVEITYLIGLTISEQKQALANLPPETIVMFTASTRDNAGNNNINAEVLRQIAPAANAPIYGATDVQLGLGIVGGSVISFETSGAETGTLGLRILAGERPDAIAPHATPNAVMFDWRELQRWGIDENKLPAGSIVRYRQPSFWALYRWRIIGAISLILLQLALIIGLLISRLKRRKAEEATRLSEVRYRNLVETQTELICRYLSDSTLIFVNDAYCRYFGKTQKQLIGTKFTDLLPEHVRGPVLSHIASLVENPSPEPFEHEVVLTNGEIGWQQWVDHVVESSEHGVELQGIGRDITERLRAEEELRQSESRFRHMADTAPVLIWMSDTDPLVTFLNKQCMEFTGLSMDALVGEGWLERIHEDDRERLIAIYTAAYERREPFVYEYRIRHADGEFHWLYSTSAPRFASDGEFLGYIGSCVDITDRKAAEAALQLAHEEVSSLKNQLEAENIYLQEEIKLAHNVDEIVGNSDAIKYVQFKIAQVAQTDTSVLVLGETGTGKELVARAIHSQSNRRDRPLVKVNCAALSPSLVESELFGHEKGAFTGAASRKIGRFELADGATIFLDEIGELPLELQAKLLRVIQEGEFERLGNARTIKVNVRLIAATNRNLKLEVEKGTFREDLWYRLNVFPITVPPLRQRKEDLSALVEHFARVFSKKIGREINSISSATMKKFQEHDWPGNIRELSNVVERALITAQGSVLHVVEQFEQPKETSDLIKSLEEVERSHITRILERTSWKVDGPKGAARILDVNPSTLRTRMTKLGIQKSIKAAGTSGLLR